MGRQILRRDKQWLVTRLKRRRDERNEVKRRDLTKIRKRRRKKENDDTVQKGRRVKSQNDERKTKLNALRSQVKKENDLETKKTRLSERSEKKKQSKKKQKKSKQNLQIQEMNQLLYSLRNILLVKSWEEERSLLLKKLLQNDLVESMLLRLLIKRTLVKICNDFVLKLRFSHE